MLGKYFSKRHPEIFFLIFPRKIASENAIVPMFKKTVLSWKFCAPAHIMSHLDKQWLLSLGLFSRRQINDIFIIPRLCVWTKVA